jgi:hypothetical protein
MDDIPEYTPAGCPDCSDLAIMAVNVARQDEAATILTELDGFTAEFRGLLDRITDFRERRGQTGPIGSDGDVKLLTLCRAFLTEHATVQDWNAELISAAEGEPAHDRWWKLLEQIRGVPACTWEGVRAKANVARRAVSLIADPESAADELAREVLAEVATWRAAP